MSGQREILLMDEQPPCCPHCGCRLDVSFAPVAEDEDGPIYAAVCAAHGTWKVQDAPADEDDDGSDE